MEREKDRGINDRVSTNFRCQSSVRMPQVRVGRECLNSVSNEFKKISSECQWIGVLLGFEGNGRDQMDFSPGLEAYSRVVQSSDVKDVSQNYRRPVRVYPCLTN